MTWVLGNLELIGELVVEHLAFALPPVLIGLLLAVPLGWLANRTRTGRTVVVKPREIRPGVRISIVEDPDGNWVEFLEVAAAS